MRSKTEKTSSTHSESIDVQNLLSFDEFPDHLKRRIRALKKLIFKKLVMKCPTDFDIQKINVVYNCKTNKSDQNDLFIYY
jgi:hypothetical protein